MSQLYWRLCAVHRANLFSSLSSHLDRLLRCCVRVPVLSKPLIAKLEKIEKLKSSAHESMKLNLIAVFEELLNTAHYEELNASDAEALESLAQAGVRFLNTKPMSAAQQTN